MAPLLTAELLRAYERRLREAGLVIVQILRLGLSEPQIDAHTADLGLRLPHEAKVGFGWHDGYEPTGFQEVIGAGVEMLSLEDAIDWYTTMQPCSATNRRPFGFLISRRMPSPMCLCCPRWES
jgi:hypothetical protein